MSRILAALGAPRETPGALATHGDTPMSALGSGDTYASLQSKAVMVRGDIK